MLKGIDISHHNYNNLVGGKFTFDGQDFVIMKATEGKTYKDPKLDFYMSQSNLPELIGFYHYARPENNTAKAEAKNFVKVIAPYIKDRDAILALDWEGNAVEWKTRADQVKWILDFLNYVEAETGVKPMIYCSAWYTVYLSEVYKNNNGLWVAHYNSSITKPKTGVYPYHAIWQYTSAGSLDKNYFNGKVAAWKAYAKKNK